VDHAICAFQWARSFLQDDSFRGKLREANAVKMEDVQAVVLETTGDISVLHGDHLEPEVLDSVRNSNLLQRS